MLLSLRACCSRCSLADRPLCTGGATALIGGAVSHLPRQRADRGRVQRPVPARRESWRSCWLSGTVAPGRLKMPLGLGRQREQRQGNLARDVGCCSPPPLVSYAVDGTARVRIENAYTWVPIREVAILFAGIFVTIIPVLRRPRRRGTAASVRPAAPPREPARRHAGRREPTSGCPGALSSGARQRAHLPRVLRSWRAATRRG